MARALNCIVFEIEIGSRVYFCSRRASCKDRLCVCVFRCETRRKQNRSCLYMFNSSLSDVETQYEYEECAFGSSGGLILMATVIGWNIEKELEKST